MHPSTQIRFCLVFIVCSMALTAVQGRLLIVKPYPKNIHPIEQENVNVTCVAFDKDNASVIPSGIAFVRIDKYGRKTQVPDEGPAGHTYMTNTTEENGRKLFTTLHINNVTRQDDAEEGGRYECEATAGAETAKYGFDVIVIAASEIPKIMITIIYNNENLTMRCNLADNGTKPLETKLALLTWKSGGEVLDQEVYANEVLATAELKPLIVRVEDVKNGGIFVCELALLLRALRQYNVTTSLTMLAVSTVMPGATGSGASPTTAVIPCSSAERFAASAFVIALGFLCHCLQQIRW